MRTKTFRLFVSSTFSDFTPEREALQSKVFPEIRHYCAEKGGFSFQPIDLRWGVSEEAQLDQKTLELCLNEVKACKSYPAPNFIILAGDRYGWIPLPYAIEKSEFESLLHVSDEEERAALREWYEEDLNAIPSSYILKERSGEFEAYDAWAEVEDRLRVILQTAAQTATIAPEAAERYFLSATEAEVMEGILEYTPNPTPYQQWLLKQGLLQPGWDKQHVCAFIRTIGGESGGTKFEDGHPTRVARFKERIRASVDNVFEVNTRLADESRLDEAYISEFETRMCEFLKARVDLMAEESAAITLLETELLSQADFLAQKLRNFQGRDDSRMTIAAYLDGEEGLDVEHASAPLVVYGPSGRGKSALMAKAIAEAYVGEEKTVVYRFTSATPDSSSSKSILMSMFEQLDVEFEADNSTQGATIARDQRESFEDFSERACQALLELGSRNETIVVFLDAIDQVSNPDRLLWLPDRLPDNLKIVISVLNDENYPADSSYYRALQPRGLNFHEIPPFEEPLDLLRATLADYGRRLQPHQEEYFLRQYAKSRTPLFITLAAEELRHWKSSDGIEGGAESVGTRRIQDLADSQRGLVREFISNLHDFSHHDGEFVARVLGFIFASRDGLSESELLQLLSSDPDFVQRMAPDTWHKNITGELPTVIWSRLAMQLRPFLKQREQDNENLLSFFHREFEEVIEKFPDTQKLHREIILSCQRLIKKHEKQDFRQNRWGKLYILLITEHELRYPEKSELTEDGRFIAGIENEQWIKDLYWEIDRGSDFQRDINDIARATVYGRVQREFAEELYSKSPSSWAFPYINALNNLSLSYGKTEQTEKARELEERSVELCRGLYTQDPTAWGQAYSVALNNLARTYGKIDRSVEAIEMSAESVKVLRELYRSSPENLASELVACLNNLALLYLRHNRVEAAISLDIEALEICRKYYPSDQQAWSENLIRALNHLAAAYSSQGLSHQAAELEEESLALCKTLYNKNPDRWVEAFVNTAHNLVSTYIELENFDEAVELALENRAICQDLYTRQPDRWFVEYNNALMGLATAYYYADKMEKAIALQSEVVEFRSRLVEANPERWLHSYIEGIAALADSYTEIGRLEEALPLQQKRVALIQDRYAENPEFWADMYATALNNLGFLYRNLEQYDQAEPLLRNALQVVEDAYGREHAETAVVLSALGWLLYLKREHTEAAELLERSLNIRTNLLGPEAGPTVAVRERLEKARRAISDGEI